MTTSGTIVLTMPSDREVRFERIFDAPRDLVWRAFTEPDLVAKWWGRGHDLDVERDEVVRGGHWRYVENAPSGPEGFEGRYREVTPPARIVRTFDYDGMPGRPSVESAEFEDLGDGRTRIVGHVLFYTPEDREGMTGAGMTQGMEESYAALDGVLASLR
jgi:uncharacterized protein YndB with AHSA1/START domain